MQELLRDDSLPYREFIQRPNEVLDYGIEWSAWLSNRWPKARSIEAGYRIRPARSTGLQYVAGGGFSGDDEPTWPTAVGETVNDGSNVWTCEALDSLSLATAVASSAWAADSPLIIAGSMLSGNLAGVLVNVPIATPDGDYYVRNTVTLSLNSMKKIGLLLIRVRKAKV